jgi:cell division septation protein DedD
MKTHTYFLSGKALAIVGGSLLMSGALVFIVGVFVGLLIQAPAQAATEGKLRDLLPPGAQPIASTDATSGNAALQRAESPAAWPFSVPAPVAAPADASAPGAADSVPAAPVPAKPKADTAAKHRAVSDVAYVVPSAEPPRRMIPDDAPFTVHVGAFRVERNAEMLMARLRSAGYRPVETVRADGGRELHVVCIGGYVGRRSAIFAAERIGDAEHLVATAVPAHARR